MNNPLNGNAELVAQRCAADIRGSTPEQQQKLVKVHLNGIKGNRARLVEAEQTVDACRRAIDLRLRVLELTERKEDGTTAMGSGPRSTG